MKFRAENLKFYKKIKAYIPQVLISLASILVLVAVISFVFFDIIRGSAEIISQKGQDEFIELQNAELVRFKANREAYLPNFEKIASSFVDSNNPVNFIEFLENITSKSRVKSEIVWPNVRGDSAAKNSSLDFTILVEGQFLDILNFSEKLEYGPFLVEIKSLSVRKNEIEKGNVFADFKVTVYTKAK